MLQDERHQNVLEIMSRTGAITIGEIFQMFEVREFSMVGHRSVNAYDEFHLEKAFIAIAGLTLEDGLTEYNLEDALVKRPLLRSAQENIVVAEGSKFGRVAFAYVGPIEGIQTVITDKNADQKLVRKLIDKGIEVIIAD